MRARTSYPLTGAVSLVQQGAPDFSDDIPVQHDEDTRPARLWPVYKQLLHVL